MSYHIADFTSQVAINAMIHHAWPNKVAELNAIATALGSDATTRDTTMQSAPVALRPGLPGNSPFTNDVLLVVNAGKAGNLTPAAMGTAITNGLAQFIPPTNTVAPVASGTGTVGNTLSCTTGTWTGATEYTYQWLRNGTNIFGATGSSHVLVAADSGTNVSCLVTATNAIGSSSASSNAIAVA
jgi:hypothetical protein